VTEVAHNTSSAITTRALALERIVRTFANAPQNAPNGPFKARAKTAQQNAPGGSFMVHGAREGRAA
jgi:hypothetical protein